MARRHISAALLGLCGLLIGGCGDGGLVGSLRRAGISQTPDEFMVLPTRPLEIPSNLAALPPPTPGRPNRVDYQPRAEAVAGLTGRPGPVGTADGGALVARVGGADPQIRARLAVEDATYRAENRGLLLERWFSRDREALIYRDMQLGAPAEFEAMRARGVGVPAPPPDLLVE